MIKVALLTISDSRKKDNDQSGKCIHALLNNIGNYAVVEYDIVPDDTEAIKAKLADYSDVLGVDLVITSGGTGLSPRDVTPEATAAVIEKIVPGIAEFMRSQGALSTKRALLSRGVAGIRKHTLIINLPGSPQGAQESLKTVLDIIPHALDMLHSKGH